MAVNVEKRYRMLRIISWVFKVLAVLILILCVIGGVASLIRTEKAPEKATSMLEEEAMKISPKSTRTISWIEFIEMGGGTALLVSVISGIIGFIMLYAFGELISLLIALEENTRRTSLILQEKG